MSYKINLYKAVKLSGIVSIDDDMISEFTWDPELELELEDVLYSFPDQEINIVDGGAHVSGYIDGSDEEERLIFKFYKQTKPVLLTDEEFQTLEAQ